MSQQCLVIECQSDRHVGFCQVFVWIKFRECFGLNTVAVNVLPSIALVVEECDANKRNTGIGC